MVAEAFHCADYESEHVADTAIFSDLTIQSADEKSHYYHAYSIKKAGQTEDTLKAKSIMEKTRVAIVKKWSNH